MKILALEKEITTVKPENYLALLRAEAEAIWQLIKLTLVREIYFTRESHLAVIILECASEEQARSHLNQLPLVKAGLIQFERMVLEPYTGLERLFKKFE